MSEEFRQALNNFRQTYGLPAVESLDGNGAADNDIPYQFGRPVESYVSPLQHARLAVWKSKLSYSLWLPNDDGYDAELGMRGPAVLAIKPN